MVERYYLADDGLEMDRDGNWVDAADYDALAADYDALAAATRAVIAGIDRTSCTCHPDYKRLGKIDPSCVCCNMDVIPEELELARKLSRKENA